MRELLRAWWHEPRPAGPPRGWRDWLLVGVFVATALLEGLVRSDLPAPTFVPVLIGVGLAPVLLWRRTSPLLMAAIAFPVCAVGEAVVGGDLSLHTLAYLLILVFSLSRWGSGRAAALGAAIVAAKIALSAAAGHLGPGDALAGAGVVSAALALGAALRYRARARQREFEQVKLLERERLARDLHDTVAHHVSAMAIRAQAGLAVLDTQPAAAADALRVIEAEATRALVEMRAMVRVLRRDEPAERTPAPRIADLEHLAGRSVQGPAVEVEFSGDLDGLPTPVATAIYRLAQESVTNARRHARHATRIVVRVACDDEVVQLRVSDDGEVPGPRVFGPTGFGLLGMRERAQLLGGSVDAGPNLDRGWTVTATLPRVAAA
ncbi:sensor histidine kinase [Micromonospora sp. C51]|uniref:sensor histidine kinase n=1 Tax=Micromonospora sp. C51 TaxID=2824879 RepID=UPI0027DCE004|nr:sensor histidine kinase [Micromonospora sp. C51]